MLNDAYIEAFKATKYQIRGHGPRTVKSMLDAMADLDRNQASDMYGNGPLINDFEEEMAALFGKESAVFFPSGTMAQQIALRIWCDEKNLKKIAYHPLSHLEIHEKDAIKEIHNIETILLGDKDRLFTLKDLELMEEVSAVLIELPQREIGGQLPEWYDLVDMIVYLKSKDIRVHLDGARIWETVPYYKKSLKEIATLFDSIYVSYYKTLGSAAGAMLMGPKDFCETSKIWKRRHGGDVIALFPYVQDSKKSYDLRKDKMEPYYIQAKDLAERFNALKGTKTIPQVPQTNMFHIHFDLNIVRMQTILIGMMTETNVAFGTLVETSDNSCRLEMTIGDNYEMVPKQAIDRAFEFLEKTIRV